MDVQLGGKIQVELKRRILSHLDATTKDVNLTLLRQTDHDSLRRSAELTDVLPNDAINRKPPLGDRVNGGYAAPETGPPVFEPLR